MLNPCLAVAVAGTQMVSQITSIDWFVIAIYFGILLTVAWWVVKKGKDSAADYFLAGRNLGWWIIGASIFASNIGSEHVVGLAGAGATSGVALAHYELHAWCLLVLAWVFVPFYMRSMVFTMPEFLERRFSPASRYVLSIVSIITFIVSKIAVGIFAGGVVFGTLLPELHITIGNTNIDSFWIGSVLVIVLTGLYTALGGMRAVAYNDAVQTFVLILGSFSLTAYGLVKLGGWHELRYWCGSDMFNLWKPMIPAGVQSSWAPVLQTDAAGHVIREAWYFNDNFPWVGMLICAPIIGLWYWCTDQYIVQRALGAPNQAVARRGGDLCFFPEIVSGLSVHNPRPHLLRASKKRQSSGTRGNDRCRWEGNFISRAGSISDDGAVSVAARPSWPGGCWTALGADGLARRRLQRLLNLVHGRSLREVETRRITAPTCPRRADGNSCNGAGGSSLDPCHQRRAGALHVPPSRAGIFGAAYFRRFFLRSVFQAAQRGGRAVGDDRRLHAWRLPHAGRYAGHTRTLRIGQWISAWLLFVDHQQYLLSIFQRADHHRFRDCDGGCQSHDSRAGLSAYSKPDLRHYHRR